MLTLGEKRTKQFLDCKQANQFQNLQRQHTNLSVADEINDLFVTVSEHFHRSRMTSAALLLLNIVNTTLSCLQK